MQMSNNKIRLDHSHRLLVISYNWGDSFIIHISPRGFVKCYDTFTIKSSGPIVNYFITDINCDQKKEVFLVVEESKPYFHLKPFALEMYDSKNIRPIRLTFDLNQSVIDGKDTFQNTKCINLLSFKGKLIAKIGKYYTTDHRQVSADYVYVSKFNLYSDSLECVLSY